MDYSDYTDALGRIVSDALTKTHELHNTIGASGTHEVRKNAHGDTALRLDIEAEEAVLATVRTAGLPVTVHSEEHGVVQLGPRPSIYTGMLDGLDGSSVYKREPGNGGYGTMLAFYAGKRPRYRDYLAAGIMDHGSGNLLLVTQGREVSIISREGTRCTTKTSGAQHLRHGSRYFVDTYFEVNRETFEKPLTGYAPQCLGSTAMHYVALITGTSDLVLECTRKGNLELAVAYPLVKAAGGVIVGLDGEDIANESFHAFGQRSHVPTIAAATPQLAEVVVKRLARQM